MQTRRWLGMLTVALVSGALLLFSASNGIALQVGDKAPDFTLKAGTGKKITLSDYQGKKPVVLFFFIGAFGNT